MNDIFINELKKKNESCWNFLGGHGNKKKRLSYMTLNYITFIYIYSIYDEDHH